MGVVVVIREVSFARLHLENADCYCAPANGRRMMNTRETQVISRERERERRNRNELPPVDPWQPLDIYAYVRKYRLKRSSTLT